MSKPHSIILLLATFLLIGVGECVAADSLTIVVSGSIRGRTTGCGCETIDSGGIQRRMALIKEHLNGDLRLPLSLDAGRFLDLDPDKGKLASECTLKGLARLGLSIVAVTPRDMFFGIPFLKKTAADADITLISANMTDGDSSLLFPVWTTVRAKSDNGVSVKIAVTALSTYQEGERFNSSGSSWKVTKPEEVMQNVRDTRPVAELTVLLCDLSEPDLREMFQQDSIFDIIVSSSRQLLTTTPFMIGKAIVASPSLDGRNLDGFRILWDSQGAVDIGKRAGWFAFPLTGRTKEDPDMLKFLNDCQQIK